MSDPVTNADIEDVLASIRRLVIEGAQPRAPAPEPQPRAEGQARGEAPARERLVLTPALRVVEPRGLHAPPRQAEGGQGAPAPGATGDKAGPEPAPDGMAPNPADLPVFRTRQGPPLRLERPVLPASAPVVHHIRGGDGARDGVGHAPPADVGEADPATSAVGMAVDEAVLRQIVAEVIRQELEGALGERITRNLRKLVRIEVASAMREAEDL
jgi:hypothetical protein